MNKSIIAIAVAGVLAAPLAAQAETKVFGKVHMSTGMVEETSGGTATTDNWQNRSHASRLGVKGSHDLGGGMKGKYHLEFEVNPDSDNSKTVGSEGDEHSDGGTAGLKRRNQWAGLAAGWGEVRIGRHDTPLKIAQGKFDQFNDTDADIKGKYKISQGENRLDNVIAYIGKFGPVKVAAAVVAGEGDGTAGNGDTVADTTSVAGIYTAGPLFVSAAMDSYDTAADAKTDSLMRIVATYKMGAMNLGLLYEDGGAGDESNDVTATGLSFAMKMGKNKIKAQYMTSEDAQTTAVEKTQTSVGFDMKLSKQVTGYVMHTIAEETQGTTTDKEYTFTGAGLVVKF